LDYDRAIKTEYEIDCMNRANRRAAAGHRAVARALRDGISEFELHLRYCEAAGLSDEGLPYPSIIGLNEHAAILHYQRRDTSAPARTVSLLIDAGAEDQAYAADVTRTYALDDEPFSALIDAMDVLQREVCANTTAGTDFVALNELAHQRLAQVLSDFDLITCSAETAWDHGVTTAFLPHGLGHLLGLQVHDVGGHSVERQAGRRNPPQRHPFLRLTRTLEADMVVTIEPGIYFIEQLIDALDRDKPGILRRATAQRFMKFGGIRIEDDLRVKSRGHENLTRSAFGE
ncbi:MAG TPA: Xaa-Pro dipeptidase, partial [Gammaproteobacteria bacterium]|nr:Xaa-Pro dipeptidase [Gammaproteobacteria bacterium]